MVIQERHQVHPPILRLSTNVNRSVCQSLLGWAARTAARGSGEDASSLPPPRTRLRAALGHGEAPGRQRGTAGQQVADPLQPTPDAAL